MSSLSNSVLRRYTPPTCTLQVVAYSSPVSRWVGQSVVKQVQFDLGLDDPRLPEEKRFRITGDGDRLEALHIAVTNYIQQLLSQSPESFNAAFWGDKDAEDRQEPATISQLDNDTEQSSLNYVDAPAAQENIDRSDRIFLEPSAGLAHKLVLGSLATRETGQAISISTLQLFDLATALDDYAADLVALPSPTRTRNSGAPFAWANIAAVLLLGVGVSALALQLLNRSNSPQTAKNVAPNNNSQVALAPSPFPTVTPAQTLTPPPVVSSISPSPSASQAPGTIPVPAKALTAPPTPGNAAPVPAPSGIASKLPPQPPGINPSPNQSGVVITVPRQKGAPVASPVPSSVALIPNPKSPSRSGNITIANTSNRNLPIKQNENLTVSDNAPPVPPQSVTAPPAPKAPTTTAYNDVPQVAEVRDYFTKRWEPPASLKQSLQYSIVLDVDGSVQLIEPYGAASRTYLDRTGMPLIGERFVSPNANGQNPRIRVLFNPDGKVQTFLEARDGR